VDIDQLVSVLRVWFHRTGQAARMMDAAGHNVITLRAMAGQ